MTISTLTIFGGADGKPPTTLPEVPDRSFISTLGAGLAGAFNGTTTSASIGTILTLSVAGVLELCAIQSANTVAGAQLKITLDGVVVYDKTASLSGGNIRNAAGTMGTTFGSADKSAGVSLVKLPFRTSLLIETTSDGVDTLNCFYRYYLT